ncbi:MAG: AAA family ATPase [bacterium]|jgi:hypothetical protein|nr:AAA family ATPase [bacterium]
MRAVPRLPGRAALLDRLTQHVDDPTIRLAVLTGPAGIGKSALLQALEARLDSAVLWLDHSCRPHDAGPGGALGGLLGRLSLRLTPAELGQLHDDPGLSRLSGAGFAWAWTRIAAAPAPDGHLSSLEELAGLLDRLGRLRPLVLVLDDLHHMDEASRCLIEGLLAHPALDESRLTLLAACRDLTALSFIEDWRRLLEGEPGLTCLDVTPLNETGLTELVARELDDSAPPALPALLSELMTHSAGLPFLALNLLREARRSGLVRATPVGWQAASIAPLVHGAAGSLNEALAGTLLARRPQSRFLLTWLEAAGHPAPLDVLHGIPAAVDWEELAGELHGQGVVRHDEEAGGWVLAHDLWAVAVRHLLQPEERRAFLLEVANRLDGPEAVRRLLRAELLCRIREEDADGDGGLRTGAAGLIAGLLEDGGGASPDLQLRLAERLSTLAEDKDHYNLAIRVLLETHQRLGSANGLADWLERADPRRLSGETRLLWLRLMPRAFTIRGRLAELPPWLDRMEATPDLEPAEQATLVLARLQRRYAASDWEGAAAEFDRLERLATLPGQRDWGRCLRWMMPATPDDPLARFAGLERELAARGGQLDDTQLLAIHFELQSLAHISGRRDLMKPHHDRMVEISGRAPAPSLRLQRERHARVLAMAGRWSEAEQILRDNLDHALRHGERALATETALTLINLLRQQRRLADALAVSELLTEEVAGPGNSYAHKALRLTALSLLWRLHRTREAAVLLEHLEGDLGEEASRELCLSLGYCRAMVRLQEAEAGGDWRAAGEAAQAMVDFYATLGRTDTEALQFAIIRDRADARRGLLDAGRRAADWLPAVETARARNEFDLVRFMTQIGELALDSGEPAVAARLVDELLQVERDEELTAAFRVSVAERDGRREEAALALLETACHARRRGQDGLLTHLSGRFPGLTAWPLPDALPAPTLCLWAWTLAEWLGAGLAISLPGLVVDNDGWEDFVRATLADCAVRRDHLTTAEAARLDKELARLRAWLDRQGGRDPGLRLQLLGGPRLWLGEGELDAARLRTRVGLELLALLAVRAWQGRGLMTREEILAAMTMGGRPVLGDGSLRVVVSRLRKALQPISAELFQHTERQGYALGGHLPLDVQDFERAWTQAQTALRGRRRAEAARCLDTCLGLYRGPFLPGGSAWTEPLRAHFEQRFMAAATERLKLLDDQEEARRELLARLRNQRPELAEFLA